MSAWDFIQYGFGLILFGVGTAIFAASFCITAGWVRDQVKKERDKW